MAQRNVYKSQLPGFRASDIQLSFANYRAQADVAGEIIKRIDTVSDFALKKVNEQKVEEGTKENGGQGGVNLLNVHGACIIRNDDPNGAAMIVAISTTLIPSSGGLSKPGLLVCGRGSANQRSINS